jgi:hypothetical protein
MSHNDQEEESRTLTSGGVTIGNLEITRAHFQKQFANFLAKLLRYSFVNILNSLYGLLMDEG